MKFTFIQWNEEIYNFQGKYNIVELKHFSSHNGVGENSFNRLAK